MDSPVIENIKKKVAVLQMYVPVRKYISPVLITSNGIIRNKYSEEIKQSVTADQLFLP
jgi:hypothetical protein